jgi:crotonobetainyl-CoA:carnitine CoA-transferase CaiB-like acyl-CoA transferase
VRGALDGLRVLELGQLVAGPFAGTLLGWLGASVLKVEAPGGDPIRSWRTVRDGTSLWWRTLSRNKHVTRLDLRTEAGRAQVRSLADEADVLIENFRPGRLEAWGLGPAELARTNPGLVVCRVSGYGQDGPLADRPGYASVAEAAGGLRHLTGTADGEAVRANLSLGDTVAGLHAAVGVLAALLHRERGGTGQVVDVSLLECVVDLLEATLPEASVGVQRGPSGGTITGVAPSGAWTCGDGRRVVIGANGEAIFGRLCGAMGVPALAQDPRFRGNPARVENRAALRAVISAWATALPADDVVSRLAEAGVPCGPVRTPSELLRDPQLQARGMLSEVLIGGERVVMPELAPRLVGTPGRTRWPGGDPVPLDEALAAWRGASGT